MNATVTCNELGQSVEIGALDLGLLAVSEHLGNHVVRAGEVLEHLGVGGVVATLGLLETRRGQPQIIKKHAGELHGTIDVELATGGGKDLLAALLDVRSQFV